ncbi:MAG: CDP-2,3-bis-(O-geranylgeranyl)-sn-glycerol synthase [Candidatus Lokiarchaeota archaeon]|nr:CDP-2,3-bis-(O-geranylgeranyl)-sn-glycerol synthase [Candidatus Lokiarchaeota archaeon]
MSKPNKLSESDQKHKKIAEILALSFGFFFFIHFLITSVLYSWADWSATLIFSLFLIIPAYISNAGMVLVGGGKPIDGGRNFFDGRRLFGDHKTWKGIIFGPLYVGIPISIGIFLLFFILWESIIPIIQTASDAGIYKLYIDISVYEYYFVGIGYPVGFIYLIIRVIICSYGAGIGDLIGSFLKRRFNIASGKPFWVVDQLDFAIFTIIFTSIIALILPNQFLIPDLNIILFLLILTPSVSIIANIIGYFLGVKEVPW